MSPAQLEIQLIALLVAVACSLPGVFLVLRRMALMSDAISHSILLGIVLGFFLVRDTSSPLLIVAAAAMGIVTVYLVEALAGTRLVANDAAIGLVFPLLFSIAVILIARFAEGVHLDADVVLLGDLAFAPFDRIIAWGYDLGPKNLWVMGAILLVNVAFIGAFFKELKLATFDPALAAALGFSPLLIHYALMTVVSVTAVGAFDAVGSILVVALMIAPPAAAYLVTDRLAHMVLISAGLGAVSAIAGFWLAHALDASIAGSMAVASGVSFSAAFVAAPRRGLLAGVRRRRRQRWEFAQAMLTIHLLNHERTERESVENDMRHLHDGLRWTPEFTSEVVYQAERRGLVARRGPLLHLTESGRSRAESALLS